MSSLSHAHFKFKSEYKWEYLENYTDIDSVIALHSYHTFVYYVWSHQDGVMWSFCDKTFCFPSPALSL